MHIYAMLSQPTTDKSILEHSLLVTIYKLYELARKPVIFFNVFEKEQVTCTFNGIFQPQLGIITISKCESGRSSASNLTIHVP